MNKLRKVFVLILVAAVVSFVLTGCKEKSEPTIGDRPAGETTSEDHPAGEHPTEEAPDHPEHPE